MKINSEKYSGEYSIALRKLVPLCDLSDHKFEELLGQLRLEKGSTHSVLFSQGDNQQEFFFLLDGKVEFRISNIPIQTVMAGTPEATFALAHQFPRRTSAVALTPIRYLRIPNNLMARFHNSQEDNHEINPETPQTKNDRSISENESIESILNRIQSDSISSARSNESPTPDKNIGLKTDSRRPVFPKAKLGVGRLKSIMKECRKHLKRSTSDRSNNVQNGSTRSDRNEPSVRAPEEQKLAHGSAYIQALPAQTEFKKEKKAESAEPQTLKTENHPPRSTPSTALFKLISSKPNKPLKPAVYCTNQDMVSLPGKTLVSAYDSVTLLVPPFLLDKTLVTNRDYLAFIQDTGERLPEFWQCKGPRKNELEHPVTGISLHEARQFAKWCGKRLPTTREWEAASRPIGQFRFPWGDNWDPYRCNSPELQLNETTAVGSYPKGASPEGCLDLIGNVWEWTELADNGSSIDPGYCWVFGGSFRHACARDNAASRTTVLPENRYAYLGFRCAKNID